MKRFILLLNLISIYSWADCFNANNWLNIIRNKIELSSISYSKYMIEEKNEKVKLAQEIVNKYFSNELSSSCFDMFTNGEIELLRPYITNEFYNYGLEKLKTSKLESLNNLFQEVQRETNDGQNILIFEASIIPQNTNFKAGVFRDQLRGVFMNSFNISPNEWFPIFIHEMSHRVDKRISEATLNSYKFLDSYWYYSQAQKGKKQIIDIIIRNGLDLGFLAEYRAWVVTLSNYFEGVKSDNWQRVIWLENILENKNENETIEAFTFRYLDKRFNALPDKDIYKLQSVINAHEEYRKELRKNSEINKFPEFYNLSKAIAK